MKVYILPISQRYQPASQPFRYPSHNRDYGVEQDFLAFLLKSNRLSSSSPETADKHYLPVFWTRWHLTHDYGKEGLPELQQEVNRVILDDKKTFTICQYDDGPLVNLGATTVFLSSRKNSYGNDIPLLSSPQRNPYLFRPSKKYLASFVGRLSTHPIRQQMLETLKNRHGVYIFDGDKGTKFYVRKMLESWIALCPRGYGGSSFRFFEAMQLGVVPCLIGNVDTRPFKRFINWEELSLFSPSVFALNDILDAVQQGELQRMGEKAAEVWNQELTYQRWCKYMLKELENLR